MIKPSEVQTHAPKYTQAHLNTVESQFDKAITIASKEGAWPAMVRTTREYIPAEATEEMARRYRLEGWEVELMTRGDVKATISLPKSRD